MLTLCLWGDHAERSGPCSRNGERDHATRGYFAGRQQPHDLVEEGLRLGHAAGTGGAAGQASFFGPDESHAARRSVSRLARTAGWPHIFSFIAGARTSGAVIASRTVDSRSSAMPWASFARQLAVAGATTMISARSASEMCSAPVASRGELLHVYRPPGEGLERQRPDEPRGVVGHDDRGDGPRLDQARDEHGRLIGGNAPRHAHDDLAVLEDLRVDRCIRHDKTSPQVRGCRVRPPGVFTGG